MFIKKVIFSIVFASAFSLVFVSCAPMNYDENHTSNFNTGAITGSVTGSAKGTTTRNFSSKRSNFKALPNVYNKHVTHYINFFTKGKGRVTMQRNLERSGRYKYFMQDIFRSYNLPEDLFYLAMVESGFQKNARSHKGANGYWQFIAPTGKHYGLQISRTIDERHDFELATDAAARFLMDLYGHFNNWELSLAAYNTGRTNVQAALRNRNLSYWDLINRNHLAKETRQFVPKILAMREVGNHPWKYGFYNIKYQTPLNYNEIRVEQSISFATLAKYLNVAELDLHHLNLKYRSKNITLDKSQEAIIRVPAGTRIR